MSSIVTLDVGGTSIKSGVVALDRVTVHGRPLDAVTMGSSIPTHSTASANVVLDQLTEAATSAAGIAEDDVTGLAIAFPGPFDLAGGRALIRGLHKFDSIYGLDLREALHRRLERVDPALARTTIEFARDSESAGVGEAVFGSGRTGDRVLTVTIGTGLGACLTAGGHVVEVVGDLEIERLAQRPTEGGRADDVLSARGLADRLGIETSAIQTRVDQPAVVDAIRDHGERLGAFLRPVIAELDVDLVVVGGGLVNAFATFGSSLRSALGSTSCEPATLGASGPLLGAALLAFPGCFPAMR